jgi:hypothetical protein
LSGAPLAGCSAARQVVDASSQQMPSDFLCGAPPRARFMIWLRSGILISQKSQRARHIHIPIYDILYAFLRSLFSLQMVRFSSVENAPDILLQ